MPPLPSTRPLGSSLPPMGDMPRGTAGLALSDGGRLFLTSAIVEEIQRLADRTLRVDMIGRRRSAGDAAANPASCGASSSGDKPYTVAGPFAAIFCRSVRIYFDSPASPSVRFGSTAEEVFGMEVWP